MEKRPNGESLAKTKFFSAFALKHLEQMRVLKEGRVLGIENRDWRNVSEHCLAEAVAGEILARGLGADSERVAKALLLHDWFKRNEVEGTRKGIGWEESIAKDKEELRRFGVEEEIINLTAAIIPESSDSEYLAHRSVEEKVIHFLDLSTDQSDVIDFRERIERAAQRDGAARSYSEAQRPRYGGKSLLEFTAELAEAEQKEFEEILDIEQGTLLSWLHDAIESEQKKYA